MIKPKLRTTFKQDISGALHGAVSGSVFNIFGREDIYPFQTCLNCYFFNEPSELCSKFNQRPPARVIAFGCNEHKEIGDDNSIPF